MLYRAGNLVLRTLLTLLGFGFLIDLVTIAPLALGVTKFVFVWARNVLRPRSAARANRSIRLAWQAGPSRVPGAWCCIRSSGDVGPGLRVEDTGGPDGRRRSMNPVDRSGQSGGPRRQRGLTIGARGDAQQSPCVRQRGAGVRVIKLGHRLCRRRQRCQGRTGLTDAQPGGAGHDIGTGL